MAQPPVWQDMVHEHSLHFELLDAQEVFSCGFRAMTACVAKSLLPRSWLLGLLPHQCQDGQGLLQLGKELWEDWPLKSCFRCQCLSGMAPGWSASPLPRC